MMLCEYVLKLIPEEHLKFASEEFEIFNEIHKDDAELRNAYAVYKLFEYTNANDADSRIAITAALSNMSGSTVSNGVLRTVGILIKQDSYEHAMCVDVSNLVKIRNITALIPLGYVSEEVLRCINVHSEIKDEDVVSYIDSILQIYTGLFFMKTEEVRSVAIRNKMLLFSKIESIVTTEADLNLMVQIKEIGRIVLEWSV